MAATITIVEVFSLFVVALTSATSDPVYDLARSPLVAKEGDNVTFVWNILEDNLRGMLMLVVSHNTPDQFLFLTSITQAPFITDPYKNRLEVKDGLGQGHVEFTLSQLITADAGKYLCGRGHTEQDVFSECVQTLIMINPPTNASVFLQGSLLTGSSVTLHCAAITRSSPRDHKRPMKYRWFQRDSNSNWDEIDLDMPPSSLLNQNKEGNLSVSSSGSVKSKVDKGGNLMLQNDSLEIHSLGRRDSGRLFSCIASEGLDLWSAKSQAFALKPEWKPITSDMSLTPAKSSVTMETGQTFRVTCSAVCQPACAIYWQKVTSDDQVLTLNRSMTLLLPNVGLHVQGVYRCLANNSHGVAFKSLSLAVKDPPKAWLSDKSHLAIVVAAAVVVLLVVVAIVIAVAVYHWRRRGNMPTSSWSRDKRHSDVVPLSVVTDPEL